jgi:NAD(P)-dependent dehydrogenase (short-subunit alcohol dehydrogenase family)
MSHVLIVGASKGIGRDVRPHLRRLGYTSGTVLRNITNLTPSRLYTADGILLCQRYRGPHEWKGEIAVSLTKTKRVVEMAAQHMSGGSIVIMASVAGVSVEEEQPVSYHAAKAALIEMVKYYAVTLGPKQIRVNAIIPGLTIKPEARAFYEANPELEATYKDITPLGRMGTVEDIANLVDFLISPKSSYLTGQTITLDGGIGLRSHWALARKVHPTLRTVQVTQRKPLRLPEREPDMWERKRV